MTEDQPWQVMFYFNSTDRLVWLCKNSDAADEVIELVNTTPTTYTISLEADDLNPFGYTINQFSLWFVSKLPYVPPKKKEEQTNA